MRLQTNIGAAPRTTEYWFTAGYRNESACLQATVILLAHSIDYPPKQISASTVVLSRTARTAAQIFDIFVGSLLNGIPTRFAIAFKLFECDFRIRCGRNNNSIKQYLVTAPVVVLSQERHSIPFM